MKNGLFLFLFTLLCVVTIFLPNTFAQDTTRWSLPEGAKARLGKGSIGGGIVIKREVAYSPDGTRLAVTSSIGIWVYDVETGEALDLLQGHTGSVVSVSFSPDGTTLASGSSNTVRLWNVATGRLLHTLQGHTDEVYSVSFSPDGTTLASGSGSRDGTVRLWDVATGSLLRTLQGAYGFCP